MDNWPWATGAGHGSLRPRPYPQALHHYERTRSYNRRRDGVHRLNAFRPLGELILSLHNSYDNEVVLVPDWKL